MSLFRGVVARQLENVYMETATALLLGNTSRLVAGATLSPLFEFTLVRTQTHIIWSARRYTWE